jgi:hypothetical protein
MTAPAIQPRPFICTTPIETLRLACYCGDSAPRQIPDLLAIACKSWLLATEFKLNGRFGLTSSLRVTIEPRLLKKARWTAAGFGAGNVLSRTKKK